MSSQAVSGRADQDRALQRRVAKQLSKPMQMFTQSKILAGLRARLEHTIFFLAPAVLGAYLGLSIREALSAEVQQR